MIDSALILAAGRGYRFKGHESVPHKSLVRMDGRPLIWHTCAMLQDLGVRKVIVVTGYQGQAVRATLTGQSDLHLELTFVENAQWDKSNGLSVLAAADLLQQNYLLLMADHLFDLSIAAALCRIALGPDEIVLAIDRKVGEIYDLEDATKVRLRDGRISAIGKALEVFDAADTGMFACSGALVQALRRGAEAAGGDCSLSDGMRLVAEAGNLSYLDIGAAWWQDIDTPGALDHAEYLRRRHAAGKPLPAREIKRTNEGDDGPGSQGLPVRRTQTGAGAVPAAAAAQAGNAVSRD